MRHFENDGDLQLASARFEIGEYPAQIDRARHRLSGAQGLLTEISRRRVTVRQRAGLPVGRGVRPDAQGRGRQAPRELALPQRDVLGRVVGQRDIDFEPAVAVDRQRREFGGGGTGTDRQQEDDRCDANKRLAFMGGIVLDGLLILR